jgi:putative transposase
LFEDRRGRNKKELIGREELERKIGHGKLTAQEKKLWVDALHKDLSIADQCRLMVLSRSSYYYEPVEPSAYDLMLMNRVDEIYTKWPFYGSRRILEAMRKEGLEINRKRIQGIMQSLGLLGINQDPILRRPIQRTANSRTSYGMSRPSALWKYGVRTSRTSYFETALPISLP